ncbi:MAG: cation diffusion facilitator family transporter [Patescibacteria group bacterium]|nr:cation diffusion facilitator family transporter [Patescibacteria group bacterium]
MSVRKTQGFVPVAAALLGNAILAIIKFTAALASGSSAMLSEAIHSFADTLNQLLLFIGLSRSLKKRSSTFEYGYGNERFFWALISACGVFFLGSGITLYTGVLAFLHERSIEFSWLVFVVLLISLCLESYTLYTALRELKKNFPDESWKSRIALADTSTLAVLLEDAVAVLGVVIAFLSITVSYATGNTAWDAGGSIFIGLLLAGVALVLIVRNRTHLLGKAMPEELREEVIAFVESDPAIEKVIDFKSSSIGLNTYRIKCEVEFNGSALVRTANRQTSMRETFEEIGDDLEEFKKFSVEYADRIPRLMGKKIDEIERGIRTKFPFVRHIDIEIN